MLRQLNSCLIITTVLLTVVLLIVTTWDWAFYLLKQFSKAIFWLNPTAYSFIPRLHSLAWSSYICIYYECSCTGHWRNSTRCMPRLSTVCGFPTALSVPIWDVCFLYFCWLGQVWVDPILTENFCVSVCVTPWMNCSPYLLGGELEWATCGCFRKVMLYK